MTTHRWRAATHNLSVDGNCFSHTDVRAISHVVVWWYLLPTSCRLNVQITLLLDELHKHARRLMASAFASTQSQTLYHPWRACTQRWASREATNHAGSSPASLLTSRWWLHQLADFLAIFSEFSDPCSFSNKRLARNLATFSGITGNSNVRARIVLPVLAGPS